MNSRILLLIAVLSAPAHAQLVYECLGDDGKTFFSESTCKGQGTYSQGKRGYASSFPERREIQRAMRACDAGVKAECAKLTRLAQ